MILTTQTLQQIMSFRLKAHQMQTALPLDHCILERLARHGITELTQMMLGAERERL